MHAKTLTCQLELSSKVFDMNIRDVSHEESLEEHGPRQHGPEVTLSDGRVRPLR